METKLHTELSDAELLEKYRQTGNKTFVGVLYKRYSHLVFGLCMKYFKDQDQAYDTSIGIFTKLFEDLKKHKVEYFKSWLFTYSKNFCLMQLRSAQSNLKRALTYEKDFKVFMENSEETHLQANKREEEYALLEKALADLDEEQRWCIELFYLKDKSYAQIVELTKFEMNQVKSYIQNGKRNLKLRLEKSHGEKKQR